MWDFFRFKDNEKYKNKNNSKKGDEEKADDDHHNSFELSNEKPKKHFFGCRFP